MIDQAKRVQGKVALISGAAQGVSGKVMGFGGASARILADHGASVMVGDIDVDNGEKTASEIREKGGKAEFIKLDVTLERDWVKAVNKTIYNVTKNLDNFQYNVVVANIHEIYNLLYDHVINNKTSNKTLKKQWEKITMLLMPLAPHLAHECCEKINKRYYWPKHDPKLLKDENCTIVIQVDGRKRGILEIPTNSKEIMIIKKSKEIANVSKHVENTTIIKNIYIKNKLLNFITKK